MPPGAFLVFICNCVYVLYLLFISVKVFLYVIIFFFYVFVFVVFQSMLYFSYISLALCSFFSKTTSFVNTLLLISYDSFFYNLAPSPAKQPQLVYKCHTLFQICSLNVSNVRGLGVKTKRREVFNWLKAKTFSIFMLQEVHCVKENIPMYLTKWGYQGFFSCYSKQAFVRGL